MTFKKCNKLAFMAFLSLVGAFILIIHSDVVSQQSVTDFLVDERFVARQQQVDKACRNQPDLADRTSGSDLDRYRGLASNPNLLKNIIVNDEFRVLYCYVPKVACTNWKRVMLLLTHPNVTDVGQIDSDSVHRNNVFVKLSDLEVSEIMDRLSTYRKFLFVRAPFERLISAFRSKFVMNYTSSDYFKKRFGVTILKRYRHKVTSALGDGVTFAEFAQFLIDTFERDPSRLNEHWAPYYQLCHPCDVGYTFIGKYETLAEDAQAVLGAIEAPPRARFPPVKPSKTSLYVESYLSTLTETQQEALLDIFRPDFLAFDYAFRKKTDSGE